MVFDRVKKWVRTPYAPRADVTLSLADPRFGQVRVVAAWFPRTVTVTGPGRTAAGPWTAVVDDESIHQVLSHAVVPPRILASNRDKVRLRFDGQPAPFDPGRRAMRRATFNGRATLAGRDYVLRQVWFRRATLRRDGTTVAHLHRGAKGEAPVQVTQWEPAAEQLDFLAAILLGATLGVGARGVVTHLLDALTP